MGRKSVFDRAQIDKLAEGIRVGMPIDLALERCGLARSTYYDWKADQWPRSVKIIDREWFSDTIKGAAAEAVYEALVVIKNASVGQLPPGSSWQSAAWLLERRYPEHFGRRQVEVTGAGGGPIQHMLHRYIEELSEHSGVDPIEVEGVVMERLGQVA